MDVNGAYFIEDSTVLANDKSLDSQCSNGDLIYSIGLLTTDEAYLAGGISGANYKYYLYTGNNYWTLSSSRYAGGLIVIQIVDSSGYAYTSESYSFKKNGIRPVINLKPNSLNTGDGSASNPYRIE